VGATKLARAVGCEQALISQLERKNRSSSIYNDAFAKALRVDSLWLKTGEGKAPAGFDEQEAQQGRLQMMQRHSSTVVEMNPRGRWAEPMLGATSEDLPDPDVLQKTLFNDFMDYARGAGPERTQAFIEVLTNLANVVAKEKPAREKNIRS